MKKTFFYAMAAAAFFLHTGISSAEEPVQEKKIEVLKFHVPENLGTIKERHEGNSGKTIIYIQDAHCNFEAQTNNSKILEDLVKNYGFKLVAVEGSTGLIDTAPFSQFPDKDIKNEVAVYFMKKGRITGPEYLSITSGLTFTIFGIEDEDAYKENYDAFIKTIDLKERLKQLTAALTRNAEILKQNLFSPELKEMDSKIKDYKDNKIQFLDFSKFLTAKAKKTGINISNYPNFDIQNKAMELEGKINFKKVDEERGRLIDELSKGMGKDKLSELVAKSLAFRVGKIPADEYYSFLKNMAKSARIDMARFKDFSNYTDYVNLLKDIKTADLISECDRLADDIKDRMYRNADERSVDRTAKDISMLDNLFELKLSPAEFEYFEKNRANLSYKKFIELFGKFKDRYSLTVPDAKELEAIDDNIPTAEHFYKVAKKRDSILINNTAAKMAEDKTDRAVLVTGGFHTEGISALLNEKGFSYVVITPRITDPNAENPYLDVMTNKKTPFEELLMPPE